MKKSLLVVAAMLALETSANQGNLNLLCKAEDTSEHVIENLISGDYEFVSKELTSGMEDGFGRDVYWEATEVWISKEAWSEGKKWRETFYVVNRFDLSFTVADQLKSSEQPERWQVVHKTKGSCEVVNERRI